MSIVIFLVVLLVFAAVMMLATWFLDLVREFSLSKRLKGKVQDEYTVADKGLVAAVKSFAVDIGAYLERVKFSGIPAMLDSNRQNLSKAGMSEIKASTLVGYQVLAALAVAFIAVLVFDVYNIIILAALVAGGFFSPVLWLKEKIKKRERDIFRQLPDALDILTLLVEAGLDFGSAFNKYIDSESGPLVDEFHQVRREINLGKNRIQALLDMSKRVRHKHLTSVVNSIAQSMQTGASIGPTLRILSDTYRVERAQMAEKMGQQAPMKMMVPLVLLIFPTIWILIFGPIVLSFMAGKVW